MNFMKVGKVIFRSIVLLMVCIMAIQGAPSSITPAKAPSVCGNVNYKKWHLPCGVACIHVKDSGMQKDTATNLIKGKLENIILRMKEAQDIIKDLKIKYSNGRIGNSHLVTSIQEKTEYAFDKGNIDLKNEGTTVKSSNVTEIIKADYDSMAAAIMFTEQLRFNEDSSKRYGQLSRNLNGLSDKLATVLCDFEIIQCISGSVPSTNITCQSTVAGSVQSWTTEEARSSVEYWVLRDIEKYLQVLIPKYRLI
ncbi:hypothetical protein ACJMK2_005941 [Sinanodonta woodiana]|uniref:Uncharacterized protein n=1 Tax=Sinanodonta woodiana TaxID=1069815 RepID=A0ABD3VRY0_SINWO